MLIDSSSVLVVHSDSILPLPAKKQNTTSYLPNHGLSNLLDSPLNYGKDIHPVDIITKAMEGEGIKLLLSMLPKTELEAMCNYGGIIIPVVSSDEARKSDIIKVISLAWLEYGTKKFLKKKVSDPTLALFCKNLNISGSGQHHEQIIRYINVLGLEQFSKRLEDENIKAIAEQTRDGYSLHNNSYQLEPLKKKKDSSGSSTSPSLSSPRDYPRSPEMIIINHNKKSKVKSSPKRLKKLY